MRHIVVYGCILISMTLYNAAQSDENKIRAENNIFKIQQLDSDLHLYEIDKNFALQIIYDNLNIGIIRVAPKYHFDKMLPIPDYPKYLQNEKYHELLTMIQNTKRLGKRVQWGEVGICSNNICTSRDRYEDGVIMRYDIPGKGCFGFRITYYCKMSGKIEEKKQDEVGKEIFAYSIKIKGRWYWTVKSEYEKYAKDEYVTIQRAALVEDSL